MLRRWQRRKGEIASSDLASLLMTKWGITASEVHSPPSGGITTRCSFPAKLSIFMTGLTDYYLCTIIGRRKRENPLPFGTFGANFFQTINPGRWFDPSPRREIASALSCLAMTHCSATLQGRAMPGVRLKPRTTPHAATSHCERSAAIPQSNSINSWQR